MEKLQNILKNLTILYIEDDDFIRESVTKTLNLLCKDVIAIENCDDGYAIYRQVKPNIIISDIILNNISGIEFVQLIREENTTIPIILLTASIDTKNLLDAVKLKLINYLVKPVSFEILLDTLKKLLNL
jgi:DNA-binding NtrC family response regulator